MQKGGCIPAGTRYDAHDKLERTFLRYNFVGSEIIIKFTSNKKYP